MINKSLKNKKIIISAGASGIGLATAKVCLSRGAYVYLCDVDNKSLNKLNKHSLKNKRLFTFNCDASDESQVSDLFKKIVKKTKKIDALINNVGIAGPTGSLDKLKSKDWERTIQVDVNSHFYFTKKAIPLIKKSRNGSIINISSTSARDGNVGRLSYASSKGAIETFTKVLANELGRYKIRVNSISPGPTNTRMMNENTPVQLAEKIKENIPMKRFAEVNDIANVALFLSSDLSTFITGQNLRVAGGM